MKHARCHRIACVLALAVASLAKSAPARAEPRPTLSWQPHWRRSDGWDYALTLSAAAAYVGVAAVVPQTSTTGWTSPILLDAPLRDGLVAEGRSNRALANTFSNVALYASMLHVVGDAVGVALMHQASLGTELLSIDAETYVVSLLLNGLTKRITGRRRPYAGNCEQNDNYSASCGTSDQYASFYSGHSALSATSAGLICVQHGHLAIYGGMADPAACANAVVLTILTGALRVVSDNHWATDVVTGHLIGFGTGYFLPSLLHFRGSPLKSSARVMLLPQLGDRLGLSAVGTF